MNNRRSVTLKNMRTGKTIGARSITDFCKRAKLPKTAKYHISPILEGTKLHYKDWTIPTTANQRLRLKDVFGNELNDTVQGLRRNSRFSSTAINRLRRGESFQAIRPADQSFGPVLCPRPFRVEGYTLRKGSLTFRGRTLREVAEKAGIGHISAFKLVHGYEQCISGVVLHGVEKRERSAFGF